MNRERLRILADHLPSVPAKHFDLSSWAILPGRMGGGWGKGYKEMDKLGHIPEVTCGTTACAAGWACSIPELHAAGLRLVLDSSESWPTVRYLGRSGYMALAAFFSISEEMAQQFFSPTRYFLFDKEGRRRNPQAKDVAERILEAINK